MLRVIIDFGDEMDLDPAEDMNLRPDDVECDVGVGADDGAGDETEYRGRVLWVVRDEDGVTVCESYPSEW